MKIKATTIALTLAFTCMADPVMRTSAKRAPLQGPVKTVRIYGLVTTNIERVEDRGKKNYSLTRFNKNRKVIYDTYIQNGAAPDTTFYKYDADGKLVKQTDHSEGSVVRYIDYAYDTSGNLISETHYAQNEFRGEITYRYASGNRTMRIDSFMFKKALTIYNHDLKGNIVKENVLFPNRDNMITRYTWYPDGNMRSEISTYSFGSYRTTYIYDEHDNEILAEENINSAPPYRRFASEYVYDEYGNWIRCIEDVPNDNPDYDIKQTTIRKIEYY